MDQERSLRDQLARILDWRGAHVTFERAAEGLPTAPEPPTARAWDESVAAFLADREEIGHLALDPSTARFAPIPHGEGETYLREVLLVADHNAYHVGQLVAVRRALGAWT